MNSVSFSQAAESAAAAQPNQNPKLKSAAHEFEASIMKEFLKPLQHDSLFSEESDKDADDSGGSAEALMSFGAEAMAKAISEHGGFGIAQKILDHFQDTNRPQTPEKSSKTHF